MVDWTMHSNNRGYYIGSYRRVDLGRKELLDMAIGLDNGVFCVEWSQFNYVFNSNCGSPAIHRGFAHQYGGLAEVSVGYQFDDLGGKISRSCSHRLCIRSFVRCDITFFFLRRLLRSRSDMSPAPVSKIWSKQIWSYSWPFSVWGIFTWAQQASERWALETFATTQDVGQYAVVFQLGYAPMGIVIGIATTFLYPILFQISGDATDNERNYRVHKLVWKITFICLLVTIVGFIFAFTLHEWIFPVLVSKEYRSVSYLLPWVVLAGGLFATAQLLSQKLLAEKTIHKLFVLKVSASVIGIVLTLIFTKKFGVDGVVLSSIIFAALHFFWMIYLTKNKLSTQ